MAEVLEQPKVESKPDSWADDLYTPTPDDLVDAASLPEATPTPSPETPVQTPVQAIPQVAPEAPVVDTAIVERAVRLGLTSEEIKELGPALEKVVTRMDSFGKTVWDLAQKQTPPPTQASPEEDSIPFDFGKDESGNLIKEEDLNPGIVHALKTIARNAKAEVKKGQAYLEQQTVAQQVAGRITQMAVSAGPELVKAIDRNTPQGSQKYGELLATMAGINSSMQSVGRQMTEQQLFDMAVKALDVAPAKAAQVDALKDKKEAWDKSALAAAESRDGEDTPQKRVKNLLKKYRAENSEQPAEDSPFQD